MTRRLAALALLVLALGAPAAARQGAVVSPVRPSTQSQRLPMVQLQLYTHALQHRPAREALQVVLPLLSPYGSVQVQPGGSTLLIRDTQSAMSRILPALWQFDHPAREVRLELHLVRATTTPAPLPNVTPAGVRGVVPADVLARLRKLLPFAGYQLLDRAELASREGQAVQHELAGGYRVSFLLGTVVDERRVRLGDFRLVRAEDGLELLRANVTLPFPQTLVLAATREAASPTALMLVVKGELPKATQK
jgi:hypothetical protein